MIGQVIQSGFDGCARTCRIRGKHTYQFGDCEHAVAPEGVVMFLKSFTATDGKPALGTITFTVSDLARSFNTVLRAYGCPNPARAAMAMAEHLMLIGGDRP